MPTKGKSQDLNLDTSDSRVCTETVMLCCHSGLVGICLRLILKAHIPKHS